jgi:hypothetical protein
MFSKTHSHHSLRALTALMLGTVLALGVLTLPAGAVAPPYSLTITSLSGYAATPLALSTTGQEGYEPVTYSVSPATASGCTISASTPYTLSVVTPGTCIVTANQAGDQYYPGATSSPTTITISPSPNVITITGQHASVAVGSLSDPFPQPALASSRDIVGISVDPISNTSCVLSAGKLSYLSVGTCQIDYTDPGNTLYAPATPVSQSFSVTPGTPNTIIVTSTTGNYSVPLTLTTSGGSGTGAITYTASSATATGCRVSSSTPYTLSATTAGTCSVTATQAASADYTGTSSAPTTVTFTPGSQSLVVTSLSGNFATPLVLTAAGRVGTGALTFSTFNGTAFGCAVSTTTPYTLSSTTAGSCYVTANVAADSSYAPASSMPTLVTLNSGTLTVSAGTKSAAFTGQPAVNEVTLSVSGLSAPDTASATPVTINYSGSGSTTYGPSTTPPTNPGTYSIVISSAIVVVTPDTDQANYSDSYTYLPGSLTITPLRVSVTAISNRCGYPCASVPTPSVSISGLAPSDAATASAATYTYAGIGTTTYGPSSTAPSAAGTYSVTPSNATLVFTPSVAGPGYLTPYTYVAGTLTISPSDLATLTISANTETATQIDLGYSSTVTGLLGSDTATAIGVTYTYIGEGTTTYRSTTPPTTPGTYKVTPSGGAVELSPLSDSINYAMTYLYDSGTLTLTGSSTTPPATPPTNPSTGLVITGVTGSITALLTSPLAISGRGFASGLHITTTDRYLRVKVISVSPTWVLLEIIKLPGKKLTGHFILTLTNPNKKRATANITMVLSKSKVLTGRVSVIRH